ncbi:MAG: hypothetical protein KF858_02775 [Candidatus Sumerlaeia bacterium]|nr:hypothetical protein [Candidatus Sumerlaeia bacterium]
MSGSRRRRVPVVQAAEAAGPTAAAPGAAGGGRWLALGLSVVLGVAALWLPQVTLREVRAQLLLREARRELRARPGSLRPETALRTAYRLNPDDPNIVFDLASFLVQREKGRFAAGQWNLVRPENFEEASGLLERSWAILPFRPVVARLRGETQWMLSALYEARGERERASGAAARALADFREAGRLLPRPRSRNEDFNLALMQAALREGRPDVAVEQLHMLGRIGQRAAMYGRAEGYDEMASLVWLSNGLFAHHGMELRYRLETDPGSEALLLAANHAARDLGLGAVVGETLRSMARRQKLDEKGLFLLEFLEEAARAGEGETAPKGPANEDQ